MKWANPSWFPHHKFTLKTTVQWVHVLETTVYSLETTVYLLKTKVHALETKVMHVLETTVQVYM